MARIITGIELDERRIRAAEISVQRKTVRIQRFIEEYLDPGSLTPDALSHFVSEHSIQQENVVTSVPADMLIIRQVDVPFRERAKIDKVISYEIEPLVPFPIQDLDICYRILNQEKGSSTLLVYALPRNILDRRTALFEEAGIPLRMITIASLASANTLFQMGKIHDRGLFIHLHVSPGFSILSIYEKGVLTHLQRLAWSEEAFLKKLERITGLDALTLSGRLKDISPSETDQLQDALKSDMLELMPQVRKVLQAYMMRSQDRSPEAIYLTGSASGLSLLTPLIEAEFSIPAQIPDPVSHFSHDAKDPRELSALHTPLGMALMEGGKDALKSVFRRKKFSLSAKLSASKQELRYASLAALFLLTLFAMDLFVGIKTKEYHFTQLSKETQSIFQETFPGAKNVVNELEQMKLRINEVDKQNEIFKSLFGEKPSPLEILNELSTRISDQTELAIADLTIDAKSIRLVGWTDSFNTVNLIEQELKKSNIFGTANVSNAKVAKDKNSVNFQMKIDFKESPFPLKRS